MTFVNLKKGPLCAEHYVTDYIYHINLNFKDGNAKMIQSLLTAAN